MKLTLDGIKDRQAWEKAGIKLPGYDVEAVSKKAKEAPGWIHFGIGNIFRVFIGGIADGLLEEGVLDRGITCVETFDYDVIDKIYKPYDNLSLSVILHGDGTREYKVMGALAEAVNPCSWFLSRSQKKAMPCRKQTAAGSRLWKQISRTARTEPPEQWRF